MTTVSNLPLPVCQIVVGILPAFTDALDIEITLPILSRGLGGLRFTLPNFDGAYTGAFAEGDEILAKLYRTGAAATDVFGGYITKLTPNSPEAPKHYIKVEAIDKGQALQVPGSLFSAWYSGAGGKAILTAIINSVGLTPDVDPENNIASTHNKSFDEVLHWNAVKEMSDSVVMGDGAIGADGYVDSNGIVRIFKRGIHASTVSLTDKIKSYSVDNDWYRIRNKVKIYSNPPKVDPANQPTIIPGHAYPADHDSWTEAADDANWIEYGCTITWPSSGQKVGSNYLFADPATGDPFTFRRMHNSLNCLAKGGFKSINFWVYGIEPCNWRVRLLADDTSNYFQSRPDRNQVGWSLMSLWFGPDYEYHVDNNPSGTWEAVGNPDWTDIKGVMFDVIAAPTWGIRIDGLYYGNAPYQAEVAVDPGTYGVRCLEPQWVDGLRNDNECENYGKGLLKYYKDKVKTVTLNTFGDNGFVPGYMQPVVIANDGLSASFRILEIVHRIEDVDWTTTLLMGDEPIKMDWWVRKMWEKQRLASQSIGKF